jgi:hypothetical protein
MSNAQCYARTPNIIKLWLLLCSPNLNSHPVQITSGISLQHHRVKPVLKRAIRKMSREAKIKPLDSHSIGTIPVISVKTPEPCAADGTQDLCSSGILHSIISQKSTDLINIMVEAWNQMAHVCSPAPMTPTSYSVFMYHPVTLY